MSFGINNATNINITDIEKVANSTTLPEFFIKISHYIFGGWFFFVSLWLLFFILFISFQEKDNQLLVNLLYASAVVSIVSLLMRMVWVSLEGVQVALITDYQMWIFPIVTVILIGVNWMSKRD